MIHHTTHATQEKSHASQNSQALQPPVRPEGEASEHHLRMAQVAVKALRYGSAALKPGVFTPDMHGPFVPLLRKWYLALRRFYRRDHHGSELWSAREILDSMELYWTSVRASGDYADLVAAVDGGDVKAITAELGEV